MVTRPPLSPFNSKADGAGFPARVTIQDDTLQEGSQASSVALDLDSCVEVARHLADTGVRSIEGGFAGADDARVAAVKAEVPDLTVCMNLLAARADWPTDLASAAAAGADAIFVMYRTGAPQFRAMGLSRKDAAQRIRDAVQAAQSSAHRVGFAGTFTTLAEEDLVRELFGAAAEAGATEFKISDSTGISNPEGMAYLVQLVRDATGDGSVGLHCHNDFGMGLANVIAGIRAGATAADVTIGGLGERAGLVAIDELALTLEWLYGVDTGIRLDCLPQLAQFFQQITGVPIPATKPISGEDAFTHQLDSHIALVEKDPGLVEPFSPDLIGRVRKLKLGTGSGPIAVRAKAAELGLPKCSEARALGLAAWINQEAIRRRSSISDEDFRAFYKEQGATQREM